MLAVHHLADNVLSKEMIGRHCWATWAMLYKGQDMLQYWCMLLVSDTYQQKLHVLHACVSVYSCSMRSCSLEQDMNFVMVTSDECRECVNFLPALSLVHLP